MLTHGPIPLSFCVVMHTCDNPPCCNPAHLELKDRTENNEDRDRKGRQARGEVFHRSDLNPDTVMEIRALYHCGVRGRVLAKQFSVSRDCCSEGDFGPGELHETLQDLVMDLIESEGGILGLTEDQGEVVAIKEAR